MTRHLINITRFTSLEVLQARIFQVLLGVTLAAPLFGVVLSSLFMMDIGKVYMDGVMSVSHFISVIFILFITASLLARDIEQKVCYFLVVQPSSRKAYLFGRFLGFILMYLLLMTLLSLESVVVGTVLFHDSLPVYVSGFTWFNMSSLVFLHAFPYIAVLGFVFFIASWATGFVEIIFFSLAGLLLSWVFPQVLPAIYQVGSGTEPSTFLYYIFDTLYNLLPHLNGADIALALTHDQSLSAKEIVLYLIEHIAYAGVLMGLAVWQFEKRDL